MDFSKHQHDRGGGYGIYRHFQKYFNFIVEETEVPGENHRSDKLYHIHNVVSSASSTPCHEWDDSKSQIAQVVICQTVI